MMGKQQEARHSVIKNEQAVISPIWLMYSGVGTRRYTFIWGMVGENQVFGDMDHVKVSELR
ncbi:hypothetical protein KU73_04735 [Pectobacterium wasabiae]|uniref:5-dehydro-4-deoxy-D-glucuronate isomerase n=1 Tax=Pectobacterium wasabiae TaxID=55208 RepID=A0AAW3EL06_9GAMM|nr:hypothetical protein JV38_01010 [Pectobacterium wasabiae]KGA29741.1 hypothetical protein KU73_04735 [Pectobacterium wasabiae]